MTLASSLQRYGRRSELASKASARHLTGGCLLHCLSKIPQDAETHARGAQNPRQAAADPAGLYQCAADELEGADVERVRSAVLGKPRADDAIAAAAIKSREVIDTPESSANGAHGGR